MAKTLQDLLVDKEFAAKLFKQKTEEDVRKLFHSEGAEITDEELKNLKKLCSEIFNKVKDIGEDELENMVGGANVFEEILNNKDVVNSAMMALAAFGVGIFEARNSKRSIGRKIMNITISTLIGAASGAITGGRAGQVFKFFGNVLQQG